MLNSLRRSSNRPPGRISESTFSIPPLALAASRILARMPAVSCRSRASRDATTPAAATAAPRACSASRRGCRRSASKAVSLSRSPPAGALFSAPAARVPGLDAASAATAGEGGAAVAVSGPVFAAAVVSSGRPRSVSRMFLTAKRLRRDSAAEPRGSGEVAPRGPAGAERRTASARLSGRRKAPAIAPATMAAALTGAVPC